jgi:hypothetical protein
MYWEYSFADCQWRKLLQLDRPQWFSSNLQNPSIPNATALASGRYTVIIDQKSFTQDVVVGQRPQYPRYMFQEITGAKLSLISVPGLESDYITYAWTGPMDLVAMTRFLYLRASMRRYKDYIK